MAEAMDKDTTRDLPVADSHAVKKMPFPFAERCVVP